MIGCDGLCVEAGSFSLRSVTFTVPSGGHAVLCGPTASGKTTLLEAIAGALRPSRGRVILDGVDVTDAPIESRSVGLVHQHGYLFPHLSVRENVCYAADDDSTVDDLLMRFDIAHLAARDVAALSGGERQLTALCRALASRPRVLLLDESYSALDRERRAAAMAITARYAADWSLTTLHVTHDPADHIASGAMVLRMRAGELRIG